MVHHLKIRLTFADAVLRGDKTFEIRENNRGFQRHDEVVFDVVDDFGRHLQHGLNHRRYRIGYVLNGWGLRADYCVFSIEPADVTASMAEAIPLDWIYKYRDKKLLSQTQFDAIDRMASAWVEEQEAECGIKD
jgi:hypothetical protein